MRWTVALLVVVAASTAARADVSIMPTGAGKSAAAGEERPAWTEPCVARFEAARAQAAREAPIMKRATVYVATREFDAPDDPRARADLAVVELRLDETLLDPPGREPMLISAIVTSRRSSWSDPSVTASTWDWYRRQTRHFEGEVTLHRSTVGRRVVDSILKPAVDDCLRAAERTLLR
jgi:hypothetical protein